MKRQKITILEIKSNAVMRNIKGRSEMRRTIAAILIILAAAFVFCACSDGAEENGSGGAGEESALDALPCGEWIEIEKKAEADGEYHKVKIRILDIAQDDEALDLIDDYNLSGVSETVDTSAANDDTVFAVARYEVKFGKKFPVEEYGITDVSVPIKIVGEDGGDEIVFKGTTYSGLTKTKEIGSLPQGYDFDAGDTYEGEAAFLIPKGCDTYLLMLKSGEEDWIPVDPEPQK